MLKIGVGGLFWQDVPLFQEGEHLKGMYLNSAPPSGYNTRPVGLFTKDANVSCYSTSGTFLPISETCVEYTGTGSGKVQNQFIGLSYGVYAEADSDGCTIALDDNKFTECFTALYVLAGSQHTIHGNSFTFTDDPTYWSGTTGIFNHLVDLEFADNFIFYGNKLTENRETNTAFLYVNSSGTDEKNITNDTFINDFPGTYVSGDQEYGIYFTGDNRDQFVTCNYFSKHNYCIYADATSQLSPFGCLTCACSGHCGIGCGNIFTPNAPFPWSTHTNWWVYNANTSQPLYYYDYYNYSDWENISGTGVGGIVIEDATPDININECSTILSCTEWPLGIEPIGVPAIDVRVYPNPASDNIIFDYSGMVSAKGVAINIYDIQGRNMGQFMEGEGTPEVEINTSNYADGIYIYRMILDGDMEKTGKFEVNH